MGIVVLLHEFSSKAPSMSRYYSLLMWTVQ